MIVKKICPVGHANAICERAKPIIAVTPEIDRIAPGDCECRAEDINECSGEREGAVDRRAVGEKQVVVGKAVPRRRFIPDFPDESGIFGAG